MVTPRRNDIIQCRTLKIHETKLTQGMKTSATINVQ
jgi:hypothetical protein